MSIAYDDVIELYKENKEYDDIDLNDFDKESFKEFVMENLSEEIDEVFDKELILKIIRNCLNIFQYGDTSDIGDLNEMKLDLEKRGLEYRF